MNNLLLFDLLKAFGRTGLRPASMADINVFGDDEVSGFLKKMKECGGDNLRFAQGWTDPDDGCITPPRLIFTRKCGETWSRTVDEVLMGDIELPEPEIPGYFGWFDGGAVMCLTPEQMKEFDQLDGDALMGWEQNVNGCCWFPVYKSDVNEVRRKALAEEVC